MSKFNWRTSKGAAVSLALTFTILGVAMLVPTSAVGDPPHAGASASPTQSASATPPASPPSVTPPAPSAGDDCSVLLDESDELDCYYYASDPDTPQGYFGPGICTEEFGEDIQGCLDTRREVYGHDPLICSTWMVRFNLLPGQGENKLPEKDAEAVRVEALRKDHAEKMENSRNLRAECRDQVMTVWRAMGDTLHWEELSGSQNTTSADGDGNVHQSQKVMDPSKHRALCGHLPSGEKVCGKLDCNDQPVSPTTLPDVPVQPDEEDEEDEEGKDAADDLERNEQTPTQVRCGGQPCVPAGSAEVEDRPGQNDNPGTTGCGGPCPRRTTSPSPSPSPTPSPTPAAAGSGGSQPPPSPTPSYTPVQDVDSGSPSGAPDGSSQNTDTGQETTGGTENTSDPDDTNVDGQTSQGGNPGEP